MNKIALLLGILCFCTPTYVYAKRTAPKKVASVAHEGIKYQVVHYKTDNGEQNGGYVEAIAEKSGKKLWGSLLYLVEYDKSLEKDVQDCFITSLDLNKQKTRLEVTSEAGNLYYLNLKTLKVIHVMRR